MTRLDILDTSVTISFSEEEGVKLLNILDQPKGRNCTWVITISKSTNEYINDILKIIGDDFERYISIVSDSKLDFGVVRVSKKNIFEFGQPEYDRDDVVLIRRNTGSVIEDKLGRAVSNAETTPTYLVMSQDTLNAIARVNSDVVDSYINTGKAFYHSYYKIPVAITNFVPFGSVDIID